MLFFGAVPILSKEIIGQSWTPRCMYRFIYIVDPFYKDCDVMS